MHFDGHRLIGIRSDWFLYSEMFCKLITGKCDFRIAQRNCFVIVYLCRIRPFRQWSLHILRRKIVVVFRPLQCLISDIKLPLHRYPISRRGIIIHNWDSRRTFQPKAVTISFDCNAFDIKSVFTIINDPYIPTIQTGSRIFHIIPGILLYIPDNGCLPILFTRNRFPVQCLLLISIPLMISRRRCIANLHIIHSIHQINSYTISWILQQIRNPISSCNRILLCLDGQHHKQETNQSSQFPNFRS